MYNSPIELLIADIQHQIAKEQDNEIYKAVVHYIPNINKEELLRALKYDRDQYNKGYADGRSDAVNNVGCEWIPVSEPPKEKGRYWCNVKSFSFPGRYYQTVLKWDDGFIEGRIYTDYVTHWMPLPEPPKGE